MVNANDIPPATDFWTFLSHPYRPIYGTLLTLRSGEPIPPAWIETLPQIAPRPILIVSAGLSSFEGPSNARYVAHAGANAEQWLVPEAGHGAPFRARPDEYKRRMLALFDAALSDT
jgi:fermentation-respiration switch protein FrsA (DUF1100 family)